MPFAVIVKRDAEGRAVIRSSLFPPPPEVVEQANSLDILLSKKIPQIETELRKGSHFHRGSLGPWYVLGTELRKLCDELNVSRIQERRWLWEAIENLHASETIKRASRGPARNHLEYCYRLAAFPKDLAGRMQWSEWSTFFDSRTVREELRADTWLLNKLKAGERPDRATFRQFVKNLNQRVRKLDTSLLSDEKLFSIYDSVWPASKADS